jgi:ABC-type multidrug transport system fused ATPase/permease subunit
MPVLEDPLAIAGVLAGALIAVAVLRGVASYTANVLGARLEEEVVRELRLRMHEHLLRVSTRTLAQQRRGELGARLGLEVGRVRALVSVGILGGFRQIATALALSALLLSLDLVVGGIAVASLPPLAFVITRLTRKTRRAWRNSLDAQSGLAGSATEMAGLVPLVRAYEGEAQIQAGFERQADEALAASIRAARAHARINPAVELVAAVAVSGVVLLLATRMSGAGLEPAVAASLLVSLFLLYRPIRALGPITQLVATGLAALDRVEEVLALPVEPAGGPVELPRMQREITLAGVSFAYGDRDVLTEVDLTFRAGEAVALVGASGEGKTTLLLLLLGLIRPTRGVIRIDGVEVREVTPASLRRQFGWVAQEPLLFADTVLGNIAFGDRVPDRGRAEAAARGAGAHGFVSALENGYDTLLDEAGTNLSVGQRQRLCIARALYRDAPVLLLDEPTSALDPEAEEELSRTIESLLVGGERTVVLASHRESTVRRADRVVVLAGGRVVEEGTPTDLLARDGTYRALFVQSAVQP